jgi:hypothetical protein
MNTVPEFELSWHWRPAPEGTGDQPPEFAATWAELRMAVGADPVTLVHQPDRGTLRDHVVVALYPLAEWVVFNWWSLTADARPGTQISQLRGAYRNGVGDARGPWWVRSRRHVLRAAGDGFWWPDVLFVPEGRQTRVVWMPDSATVPRQADRYTGRGNVTVPSAALERTLAGFVDGVAARLAERGITSTPLQAEWDAVRGAGPEAAGLRAAAQLGLDPYTDAAAYLGDIAAARELLPAHLAEDFFNGVGADRVRDQLSWLDRARSLIGTAPGDEGNGNAGRNGGPGADAASHPVLAELRAACADLTDRFYRPESLENPWELGFATAQRVRSWLGLAGTAAFVPETYLSYRTSPVSYLDRGLVAFGARTGRHGPTLVSSRHFTDRPRRFLLARALWHVICDRNDEFLIVAAHTHRQHIARGFALELLAPAAGIAEFLADPAHLVSSEDVEVISDHYGVGTIVVEHQLDNRVLAMDFRWPGEPSLRRLQPHLEGAAAD